MPKLTSTTKAGTRFELYANEIIALANAVKVGEWTASNYPTLVNSASTMTAAIEAFLKEVRNENKE